MDPKKDLTASRTENDSPRSIATMLDDAGLELWQAPEGFWAIRVKPAATPAAKPPRRRRARSAA